METRFMFVLSQAMDLIALRSTVHNGILYYIYTS